MVIVGAGKAASRAIVSLREHGWKGPITLVGEEAHPPYDRPPLSKASITGKDEPTPVLLLDEGILRSQGVTWHFGLAATGIDRDARMLGLADGRAIAYDRLLIATGARPRPLNVPGAEHALTLRTFEDAARLRALFLPDARVVVIGGGFIGLELAASASKRGARATVVEALPRVLMRGCPDVIAAAVAARHALAGTTILTGAKVAAIEADAVVLDDRTRIAADVIVAGIGAVPAVELARAGDLGLDNGIACDGAMRTSDPSIFAAGDCCSFPHPLYDGRRIRLEAWRSAQDQAAVAARNMLGHGVAYDAVPWFWSDQFDMSLQIAGLPDEEVGHAVRPLKDGAFIRFHLDAAGRLVGASGIGPGNAVARDIRLAEMLIGKRAAPAPSALADPNVPLKSLLNT